jgi:hypothetical protein
MVGDCTEQRCGIEHSKAKQRDPLGSFGSEPGETVRLMSELPETLMHPMYATMPQDQWYGGICALVLDFKRPGCIPELLLRDFVTAPSFSQLSYAEHRSGPWLQTRSQANQLCDICSNSVSCVEIRRMYGGILSCEHENPARRRGLVST